MRIEHRVINDIDILELSGNMVVGKVEELKTYITGIGQQKYVLANLKDIEYIDSSGIGIMIYLWQRLKEHQGVLAVCDLNEKIKRVFMMAHLESFIKVYPSEADALQDENLRTPIINPS